MDKNEADFLKELLAMFKIEAEEHIKDMYSGLLELEKAPVGDEQKVVLETVYREAHSLKGAARAVNLIEVETLCQSLESVFAAFKRGKLELSAEAFDILHCAVDILTDLIDSPDGQDISEIMHQLERLEKGGMGDNVRRQESRSSESESRSPDTPRTDKREPKERVTKKREPQKAEKDPVRSSQGVEKSARRGELLDDKRDLLSETVRISTTRLNSLLRQTEEMLATKLSANQHVSDFQDIINMLSVWKKEWEKYDSEIRVIRQSYENQKERYAGGQANTKYEELINFLDWNQEWVKAFENRIMPMMKLADNNSRVLGGMVDGLLEDIKKVLMIPFSTLLKIIPKIVRDLSRDQGKNVELVVRGSTTEVDRRILEEMKDPLIHLLRNCIDHGIDKPNERIQKNKPASGTISVSISQLSDNKVEIIVADDGSGIDPIEVREVAVNRGVISEKEVNKLNDQEALSLIFQSEVSTSPIITDISGRGLGLAIVREKVEKLGGQVSLEAERGVGTTFRIVLPVTLATFRGILVQVSGQVFVVPTLYVERVTRVKTDMIKTVENRETITLDERAVSLARLADVLELPREERQGEGSSFIQIMVLSSGEKNIAFVVDEILNEREVLVKSMGNQLTRVRNISGATILGTGKVVAILNVSDLMKSAVKVPTAPVIEAKKQEVDLMKKSILVAEDSITSRTLLKNILVSAGYDVKTTVDGLDAFTALRTGDFDLVVSDIEMPRMNGFDLVSRIRSDRKTTDLPVVLVTGLESREDRERGIDVGANAYIVKRSFDQSNLLEVIRKLI